MSLPVQHHAAPDTDHLRRVFGAYPTGVTALAAIVDGKPVGMAASSFTSVSLAPPIVSVCIAHSSSTWPVLRRTRRLGVSVLAADQVDACRALSARDTDRFADLRWRETFGGAVLLDDAGAWIETSIRQVVRAGDHDVVLLDVHDLDRADEVAPLVFHGSAFRRLAEGE
ncbi:flavin reductase family protein [Calidifontibacter indicus]|uniref:Flavin reductase (DIM6/NTAB) family NADH-FMN oxidoreductase RutF n=1 Tax=Calidifontibacter indicus TaxID=419650 RepID=A0A3D9UQP4_9MICO|nr:flavin reductase family protein [Calidifontibacter indicus]REF31782.1 flavin reductase (DIM6/NTAB) family NADH-FMN oxidoreductase RutF [Calidifontibacter indicus]